MRAKNTPSFEEATPLRVTPYTRIAQYYETDQMGIIHHAAYVHWMEEARVDFLSQIGWGLDKIEAMGIVSPVVAISCKYKQTTTFPEQVFITVSLDEVKGARLRLSYVMKNSSGQTVLEARSENCFTDKDGKVLRIDRRFPEFYQALCRLAEANQA